MTKGPTIVPSPAGIRSGRRPEATRPQRMDPLATLPVFFKLDGRRVLVAGGTEAAAWKLELIAASGAHIDVFAPDPCAELLDIAESPPAGRIVIHRRAWHVGDFAGAVLAIGGIEDDAEGRAFACAAREAGVPVNVVDRPEMCAFQFGSIVNRSPLVVAISTDGAAPVFGQTVRASIEALLPPGLKQWAQAAKMWRPDVQKLRLAFSSRRRFWERFTEIALREPDRAPARGDFDDLMRLATGEVEAPSTRGSVMLVGAGPGNPELLTLKAVRALRSADVILYDDLVSAEVLDFARREAKRMLVGKSGRKPSCKQDEINDLMIALARQGKRVVRLKSGDPMIFGRAGEEMAALEAEGIAVDVVPGITAVQGAGADLKISLTHRDHAQRLQFVTGHARSGALPDTLDAHALADPHATTAIYMPLGTMAELVAKMVAAGASPDRPACAVFNASRPESHTVRSTLGGIVDAIAQDRPEGPCLLIIGEVTAERDALAASDPATAVMETSRSP